MRSTDHTLAVADAGQTSPDEGPLEHQIPVVEDPRVRPCGHCPDLPSEEREVMVLLAGDLNVVEIAERTGASDYGVRTRLKELGQRLGAATSPQIVDIACRTGLLIPQRAVLKTPISVSALTSFQALAEGGTRAWIARRKKVSEGTVATHLAAVRSRMRASWNAAAVYRLHGVEPAVLRATTPPCPVCGVGEAER